MYHDDTGCTQGNNIEPENRQQGTGGKEKCSTCLRLQRDRQWAPEPRRSSPSMGRLKDELEACIQSEQVTPVLDTVLSLPKNELAEMAETLVNLTSFRQRVSPDAETVGGPVDVAIISRGDGFVWIKRKHYFQAELNHQFFNNYFDSRK